MKKSVKAMKYWLEVDEEKGIYRQVRIEGDTERGRINIVFIDNKALGKNTEEIQLTNTCVYFSSTYLQVIGYENAGQKLYRLKGYYLYILKPYVRPAKK